MDKLPHHVAIIPDGNRRWAESKGISRLEGHQRGAERMREVVENALQHGIKFLTVWGFSTDNWKRTKEEVESIFQLLQLWIEKQTPWAHSNGIRLRHIGRFHELPQGLQKAISQALDLTRHNTAMTLNVAFNYTGRAEIVDAVNKLLADRLPHWGLATPTTDEAEFSHYLNTDGIPDVDLVIRTAGEFRLSNFMLWQTAYSEFYFTPVFWPDFDKLEFEKALVAYRQRDRRLGGN